MAGRWASWPGRCRNSSALLPMIAWRPERRGRRSLAFCDHGASRREKWPNAAQDAPAPRLPEPPFVQPAAEEQRQLNYWLMDKRVVTLPFNLFSSGFALAVYALFFLLSDLGHWQVGFFRTLGQNALAAYILHEIIGNAVGAYAPHDAPLWWVATTFVLYVGITYLFVRHLEKNGVFLRM